MYSYIKCPKSNLKYNINSNYGRNLIQIMVEI